MYTTPRINPFQASPMQATHQYPAPAKPTGFLDDVSKSSFKDVMGGLIKDTDKNLSMPDELMNRALTTGDVDIHEVMIANTKADITINVASQVVTKVIQAYERVQQIQV